MNIISGIRNSGFLAQSAYSADIANKDALGRVIDTTYLTAHQDLSNYATKDDLSAYTERTDFNAAIESIDSGKLDVSSFSSVSSDFLQSADLDGYATENWVDSQGYLTAVDIPESAVWNATTQTVSANSAQWAGGTANPQIPVTGINGIKISESGDKVVFEVSANYATEDWVTSQGYLTAETDWTNTITAASANAYEQATAAIPTGLATTGDLQTVSGEITALIPSTAGLATESFVTSQGYITNDAITGKQDITGMTAYATVESLTAKQDAGDYLSATDSANFLLTSDSGNFYTTANESGFITGVDLTPYQLTADMTAYMTTADSANFYTTANESGYLTAVPDTYLQNTDLSTEDGKVTAISGIPLSAGGDVPEGVMVESGLEYNAVNEISAYNGSAIAQYGAEKQWLVHDDTLVHAANSAQYALGVNLSAVAQLLGIDETLLWEGTLPMTTGSTARCSESIYNFNKIKFLYNVSADNEYQQNSNYVVETDQTSATNRISWQDGFTIGNNWYNRYYNRFTVSNGTDLTLTNANCYWGYTADAGNSLSGHAGHFYKIIGIGRKA